MKQRLPGTSLSSDMEHINVHEHLCLIYNDQNEQSSAVTPFIRIGLGLGERCIYISNEDEASSTKKTLQSAGINVAEAVRSSALSILTKHDTFLMDGFFDPAYMITFLNRSVDDAKAAGFSTLRITCDMTWALDEGMKSEKLIEYEAGLNNLCASNDALAICQYDRRRFPATTLRSVVEAHPIVIHGGQIRNNFYYIPPEESLSHDSGKDLDRLLSNMSEQHRIVNALQGSEEKYRALVELSPDLIGVHSHGRWIYMNDAGIQKFGASRQEDITGRPVLDLVHPDYHSVVRERIFRAFEQNCVAPTLEEKLLKLDGTVFEAEVTGMPIMYDGAPACMTVARDITERKRLNMALKLSLQKSEEMVNSIDGIIWEAKPATLRFTFVSKQAERLLGYPVEQWLSEPSFWKDHIYEEDRKSAIEYCLTATSERRNHEFEYRMVSSDGRLVWLRDIVNVVTHNGQIEKLTGVMVDITRRKQLEDQLHEERRSMRAILDNAPVGIWRLDMNKRIKFINPTFCNTIGVSEDRFLGSEHYSELLPEDVSRNCMASDKACLDSSTQISSLEEIPCVDGKVHSFEIIKAPILDEQGVLQGLVALATDVTERRRTHDALQRSEEKFRILSEQSPNMIFINQDENIVFANAQCEVSIGYSIGELCSSSFDFRTLIPSEQHDMINASLARHKRGEDVPPYECTLITKSGKRLDTIISTRLIAYGRGRAILGIITDITAQKQSEEMFKNVFEYANDSIFIIEPETRRFLNLNELAARQLGYSKEELLKLDIYDITSPAVSEDIDNIMLKLNLTGGIVFELIHLRKDGSEIPVEISAKIINYGGRKAFQSIVRDITKRKRTETALKEKIDELKRFNELAVGRELRMIELKKEINALLDDLGRPEKYRIPLFGTDIV